MWNHILQDQHGKNYALGWESLPQSHFINELSPLCGSRFSYEEYKIPIWTRNKKGG